MEKRIINCDKKESLYVLGYRERTPHTDKFLARGSVLVCWQKVQHIETREFLKGQKSCITANFYAYVYYCQPKETNIMSGIKGDNPIYLNFDH